MRTSMCSNEMFGNALYRLGTFHHLTELCITGLALQSCRRIVSEITAVLDNVRMTRAMEL